MKLSQIRKIKNFCESLYSNPDWREVVQAIENNETDFEVDNVRFIDDNEIMEVLTNELSHDEYVLGCFNAWAIAQATDWPIVLIEAAQKAEALEEIGKAMTREQISNLAEIYAREDGFGHHFNSYDGCEEEFQINNNFYHVFDNR